MILEILLIIGAVSAIIGAIIPKESDEKWKNVSLVLLITGLNLFSATGAVHLVC